MKQLICLIALAATISTTNAQVRRNSAKPIADSVVEVNGQQQKINRRDMMKELNLSKEQRKQLKEIRQSNQSAKAAIENNTGLSAEQKQKELKALRRQQLEKMKAILTPEQLEKFKKLRQGQREEDE